ncbi:MAG: VTT domain-containing protein [Candidatus Paceibacterota bacterium]|jgi:membrane protein DedA with SNARE-associated domain
MDLHSIISSGSYLAIFILMLTNGVANLPSSQLLYIVAGYFVSTGNLFFVPTIIAGAFGNAIGNIITYKLVKKYDKPFARKLLMLDEENFRKIHSALHSTFTDKGMWWIFLGKLTPSVKAFIPIVSGLANTPAKLTYFIFLTASLIWASAITSLGYYFGEQITFKSFTTVSLLVGGIIIFIMYKNISKKLENK